MWAHWGPQCVPEQGDWYARQIYEPGSRDYIAHVARYGHPSKAGFKDVIRQWRAESWHPDELLALYGQTGAQYFMALANHHDNMDLWNSRHQPWNSVRVGPKKDLVGGWSRAARRAGMKFGVSVHAAHAWSWYEVAQGADKDGPFAGVPYDGKLTRAQGKGEWWDGLDPQDLYEQRHVPGKRLQWEWNAAEGSSVPDKAYCERFYARTMDLIEQHDPDLVYFDDTALPLYPISDVGLRIAANFYNRSLRKNGGRLEGVITGKVLTEEQRKCMVWDIERGVATDVMPLPWQTDTCIGEWHYSRPVFARHGYKSARMVAQMLVDIVSKNGNLMLNVPLPGSGAPDDDELSFIADFGRWMRANGARSMRAGRGPCTARARPRSRRRRSARKGSTRVRTSHTPRRLPLRAEGRQGLRVRARVAGQWPTRDQVARSRFISRSRTSRTRDAARHARRSRAHTRQGGAARDATGTSAWRLRVHLRDIRQRTHKGLNRITSSRESCRRPR
jgi:alpha-L-fucosidase